MSIPEAERVTVAEQPRTTLVTDPKTKPRYTANQETDVHTALTRGLAEYLQTLTWTGPGGRFLRFRKTLDTWAEPEDLSAGGLPAAVVFGPTPGKYDASKFTPVALPQEQIAQPDGRYLVSAAEFQQDLVIEAWATDTEERKGIVAMVENGLMVGEFLYGVRLALPHYFGAQADFEPLGMGYEDSPETAIQRLRLARFTIRAQLPVIQLVPYPGAIPRSVVSASLVPITADPSVPAPGLPMPSGSPDDG